MLQAVKKDYYYPYHQEYRQEIKHIDIKKEKAQAVKCFKLSYRAKTLIAIMICVAVCFVILYRYSVITESTYRLNQYSKELERLVSANIRLRIEADKSIDLVNIENIAKSRLKMQRPDQYQIVYLKVPREDYTQIADNTHLKASNREDGLISTENMFLGSLYNSFSRIINFLY